MRLRKKFLNAIIIMVSSRKYTAKATVGTNRNAVSMSQLAEGTKILGSTAANSGIKVNEMTAALGTVIATTQVEGSEAARALKGIIMNLQNISGKTIELEDGDILDSTSFKKTEDTLNSVGVAMETVSDGATKLRNPIEILKELSQVYNSLPSDSTEKAKIISDLGGKIYLVA